MEFDAPYNKREMDLLITGIKDDLSEIKKNSQDMLVQVKYTNGRVTRLERNVLVLAVVLATVLVLKYQEVAAILKLFI